MRKGPAVADEPDFTEITIRSEVGEERQIAKHALPFFPGWQRVDSQGRPVTTKKES